MPDPIAAQPQVPPAESQQDQANPTQPDATAKVQELETLVRKMQGQLNLLHAEHRVKAKQAEPQEAEAATLSLKSLKEAQDARDKRSRDKAIRVEVDAWCKSAGVDPQAIPFVKAYIQQEHSAQLTVDDSTDAVLWKNEFEQLVPFAELGKKILMGPGGQSLLPPTSTPGSVGQRGSNGVTSPSIAGGKPLDQWTPEDWRKNQAAGLSALREGLRRQHGL